MSSFSAAWGGLLLAIIAGGFSVAVFRDVLGVHPVTVIVGAMVVFLAVWGITAWALERAWAR